MSKSTIYCGDREQFVDMMCRLTREGIIFMAFVDNLKIEIQGY